ncbi:Protein-tyrosine-phosphatase IBR5 [Heracleum sosnowskyi]|uniref:Protein-tyrosine-phosphatase IBR5 n=1 Tax=Heracleum sosnowskyi TaxID=360622 RepID=A0AAD8GT85_9APIA|nr:Protein-tyrosine-phosphatase IBR5 [Heracleum sosnowskyi]
MRKRERENPCGVCGHYHKEHETCGICGHRLPNADAQQTAAQLSAFPSEILPDFLFLGSYDNASRSELLKTQGISRVLNTVPACQNLYKNTFTYHCLQDEESIPFDDAMNFLEQCEKDRARVLVHCMSGKNRSPAVVVAYLMKSKGWRLGQSYQWVKERRPSVEISQAVYQQLHDFERKIFGNIENNDPILPVFSSSSVAPAFNFGFEKPNDGTALPAFGNAGTTSIFTSPTSEIPQEFTFGAAQIQNNGAFPRG